ncbi:RepB family plasmid replication initiator protein [Pantoea sp. Nvir]|uniref:RepB family plasmid replication initiator protein n=1 Tax=Pantoea sp. Nvir TaxID=2576760 RepID=UPI0013596538|nr:RepB family plasmid replication initiator protein [Pantoea sp. Nvir]MXP67116.1 RepB family plasmid replication initiator protein [Pantoea sp. Nvir]CAJ0993601.1 Replication protein RepA [Pantoea sp. Nvir]
MIDKFFIADALYGDMVSKEKQLTVNSNNTVQPVALMRLGVFVPKPTKSQGENNIVDASELFSQLELAKAEGYDNINISGPRLDMDCDFKVWIGIIYAFSKGGMNTNKIELKFTKFAKGCGFSAKRIDGRLRSSIHDSLGKLRNKSISFKRGADVRGSYQTGLLKTGYFDADRDIIQLEVDEKLWELFQLDYRVLLQQYAIKALPKKEAAQAIYTFIESLPANPVPVGFQRLRERLSLTSTVSEQNRTIKKALDQLQHIGYLKFSLFRKERENFLIIHKRNPKLKQLDL